jgi:hypothetical protein
MVQYDTRRVSAHRSPNDLSVGNDQIAGNDPEDATVLPGGFICVQNGVQVASLAGDMNRRYAYDDTKI